MATIVLALREYALYDMMADKFIERYMRYSFGRTSRGRQSQSMANEKSNETRLICHRLQTVLRVPIPIYRYIPL